MTRGGGVTRGVVGETGEVLERVLLFPQVDAADQGEQQEYNKHHVYYSARVRSYGRLYK